MANFLKNYVFDFEDMPLFEDIDSLSNLKDKMNASNSEFYRKKLIAQLSAEGYMTRFDHDSGNHSKAITRELFKLFPNNEKNHDITLLFNLQFYKAIAAMRDQPEVIEFDTEYKNIANKLLSVDPNNPYVNYYMANFHQVKGNMDSISYYYNKIVDAKNFSPWWYTNEAKQWLESQN